MKGKNMKTVKELLKFIGFMCIVAVCIWFGYEAGKLAEDYPEPFKIPTVEEVQTMLVNRGYDVGPDGIDGKMAKCNTLTAWRQAEFDQYAAKFMTASGAPREK